MVQSSALTNGSGYFSGKFNVPYTVPVAHGVRIQCTLVSCCFARSRQSVPSQFHSMRAQLLARIDCKQRCGIPVPCPTKEGTFITLTKFLWTDREHATWKKHLSPKETCKINSGWKDNVFMIICLPVLRSSMIICLCVQEEARCLSSFFFSFPFVVFECYVCPSSYFSLCSII